MNVNSQNQKIDPVNGSPGVKREVEFNRYDLLIIFLILIIFLTIRLPRLSFPPTYNLDEAYYVPGARSYFTPDKIDPNPAHPPLAKIIMGLFIKIFGTDPIGWRSGSIFFGALTVMLTYIFAIYMFGRRIYGAASAFLVSTDFLQIVQSRIATIDVYVSFFILCALFFAYLYARVPPGERSITHKWSILAAVSTGLAVSCKLSGFSALLAIAMFYFFVFWREQKKLLVKKLLLLIGFYLGVIALIFTASHVPLFLKGVGISHMFYTGTLKLHYRMQFVHPQLAKIWQWVILQRPFWHYYSKKADTITGIFAFGNFVFWWGFLIIFIRTIYLAIRKKQNNYIMIVTGYLGLYLFWLSSFQVRNGQFYFKGGFIYYMLPCVPFMAFAVAEVIGKAWKSRVGKLNVIVYFASILFFLNWYYPLLTGITKPLSFFNKLFGFNLYWLIALVVFLNVQLFTPWVQSLGSDK